MRYVSKVQGKTADDSLTVNLSDVMLLDPEFQKLKTSLSHLLYRLSQKYQLTDEQILQIAIDHLHDPHKASL